MDGKSIRMFFCGLLTMALIMTTVPVYADGTSAYDRIVAAITGNNSSANLANINTQLSNINTGLDNISEALGSSSDLNGEPVLLWEYSSASKNINETEFFQKTEPYTTVFIEVTATYGGDRYVFTGSTLVTALYDCMSSYPSSNPSTVIRYWIKCTDSLGQCIFLTKCISQYSDTLSLQVYVHSSYSFNKVKVYGIP